MLSIKPQVEPVELDAGTVYVREFDGHTRARLAKLANSGADADLGTWAVLFASCDETGKPSYTEDDFARVDAVPAKVLEKVALAALALNGMSPESVTEKKS